MLHMLTAQTSSAVTDAVRFVLRLHILGQSYIYDFWAMARLKNEEVGDLIDE